MTGTDFLISDQAALDELVERLSAAKVVSVDTEFVRERTYYAQLCLIQLAVDETTACIDCLAALDLKPLFASLMEPHKTWLLHSARQDLEVVHQHADALPERLIDSQIAAALLGYAPQIGLGDVLQTVLCVSLDKSLARTNWAKRPLPAPAILYALDDVRHLASLWHVLEEQLRDQDRSSWLEEDCRTALNTPLATPTEIIWSRLRGLGSVGRSAKCAALSLVQWREECAKTLNRPRRWILSDELLLRVADAQPETPEDLTSIPEIPPRLASRFGGEILAAVADTGPEKQRLVERELNRPRPDKARLKRLQDGVKQRARELGIHPEVLATRKELGGLLTGEPSGRIVNGWRREVLGKIIDGIEPG